MSAVSAPTRERLLAAARAVIEEGGYGAATVAAITERSGVAAGTLYRHFASKEELFVEVFRAACEREISAMRAAAEEMPPEASDLARLESILATFARRALRRRRMAWALLAEPVDPLVDAERLAYRERYRALTATALRGAVAAGELPALAAADVDLTAAALVGGCGEVLVGPLSPLAGPDSPSDADVLDGLRAFVRRAVGAVASPLV